MKKILFALATLAVASVASAQTKVDSRLVVSGGTPIDTVIAGKVGTTDARLPVRDDTNKSTVLISTMPRTSLTANSVAIGHNALALNVDSDATTAVGTDAAAGTTTGRTSSYFGYRAGYRANGNSNTCIGAFTCGSAAGDLNAYPSFQGGNNTVTGEAAGLFMSGVGPNFNALYGFNAGFQLRGGDSNSFFGTGAGRSIADGILNTAIGNSAMKWPVAGDRNLYVGNSAGQGKQEIHNLSAALAQGGTTLYFADNPTTWASVGDVLAAGGCLYDPAVSKITAVFSDRVTIDTPANTGNCGVGYPVTNTFKAATGTYNVGIGPSALSGVNGSMSYNVAVGGLAGQNLAATDDTQARYNTMIGHQACSTLVSGIRNICLGYNSQVPDTAGTGQMSLGNLFYATGRTTVAGSGLVGIGRVDPQFKLHVAGTLGIDSPSPSGAGDAALCWASATGEVRQGAACGGGYFPGIERAATNLLARTKAIGTSPWTLTNAAVSSATVTTPYQGADAQTVSSSASGGYVEEIAATSDSAGVHTASLFFSADSAAATYSVRLGLCGTTAACNSSPTVGTVNYVVSTGLSNCTAGFVCGTAAVGGWRRIWVSRANNASTYVSERIYVNGGSGDASSAVIWGPQIEVQPAGTDVSTAAPSSPMICGAASCGRTNGVSPYVLGTATGTPG